MSSNTEAFEDATAKEPKGFLIPAVANFRLIAKDTETLHKWLRLTFSVDRINAHTHWDLAPIEEKDQVAIDQIRYKLIEDFALNCEILSSSRDLTSADIETCYAELQEHAQRMINDDTSRHIRTVRNPKFAVPTLTEVAAALNGVWVHTAILNQHVENMAADHTAPAPNRDDGPS